ncbi:protein NDUFAF4 homolog [Hylaeus volcanicus]|uniref:protein NDUFAF4 homolog n=1 Tax=Hylaeus volcanicus TaxID=313075 RepID=UPI0023B8688B|nr:protein NDUFAF4 homolog [Hylaeus volcanicus]XP_053978774.1 protein NDUFAF4 homolog [Hylaeus volcanicus]XP_053978775.1 protein NDUFAF4 homolog [Hylaeus volcanicus]XP_053978776.1 protein NDUFAF4 homolog [Hylaeus volcanicus]XP_053978777.1 protein NDUFAF4 homolog [Hylaeus volcanicus]XP_053978778.1 protein NDUFAF4 homolog [Hylaeus volcanicus]
MGKVYSTLMRPLRTFDIVHRAHDVISEQKPTAAPQYPSTAKEKELVDKMDPDFMKKHNEKNAQLDSRLKEVYVTSNDPNNESAKQPASSRPLPLNRTTSSSFEFGFYESRVIPEGKCSLRQALTFLGNHNNNPTEYTIEKIALEYKLDKQVVANIIEHFSVPRMVMPRKNEKKSIQKK